MHVHYYITQYNKVKEVDYYIHITFLIVTQGILTILHLLPNGQYLTSPKIVYTLTKS